MTTSEFALDFPPPRHNVVLLTCMDRRLIDNVTRFMNKQNLRNRYYHLIFAGAALGALGVPRAGELTVPHWKRAFFEQLDAATKLSRIEDVYILQHRHCGAYHDVFGVSKPFADTTEGQADEHELHAKDAKALEEEIGKWANKMDKLPLRVRSFLMDLRGDVSLIR